MVIYQLQLIEPLHSVTKHSVLLSQMLYKGKHFFYQEKNKQVAEKYVHDSI
jgi:hypothetical protein